jgi:hypothetical protein
MRRKTNMATRETTNKILEMIDECVLDPKDVVMMCLKWMSEDNVKEMCEANEIYFDDEDYSDYSEEELREMGCFDNLNEDDEYEEN